MRTGMIGLMNRHIENVKQAKKADPNAGSTLGFAATSNNPALSMLQESAITG
jgi:hypothetical protein